jgi:hypothetical protein
MDYLSFIRKKPCSVCYDTMVDSDAHHLKSVGMGNKRKDMSEDDHVNRGVVPLCRPHHQEYHSIGLKSFDEKYGVNLWRDCYQFLLEYINQREKWMDAIDSIDIITDETFGVS